MTSRKYVVVGVTFEHRQDILSDFFRDYKHGRIYEVYLYKEDDNPYDKNAVSVLLEVNEKIEKIGYISKNENVELRNMFEKIDSARVESIGPNRNGDIGLSITINFHD